MKKINELTLEFQRQARLHKSKGINELCRELEENSKREPSRDHFKTLKPPRRKTVEKALLNMHSAMIKERWREYTETLYQCNTNLTQVVLRFFWKF